VIQIHPEDFIKLSGEQLEDNINEKYANKVRPRSGSLWAHLLSVPFR